MIKYSDVLFYHNPFNISHNIAIMKTDPIWDSELIKNIPQILPTQASYEPSIARVLGKITTGCNLFQLNP